MRIELNNATVFRDRANAKTCVTVDDGRIRDFNQSFVQTPFSFDFTDKIIIPGLIDVHTHLREPGFFYKETIESGTYAAAKGGFTDICCMPNVQPCPDDEDGLKIMQDIIDKDARVHVYPYGAITVGEKGEKLSDMDKLFDKVVAFSDDGKGVTDASLMLKAMEKAKTYGKIIVAHCEDKAMASGGCVNLCDYSSAHGLKGINNESEYSMIARDLELNAKVKGKYHVCHVSCAESVDLIRQAKKDGQDVTSETAPHYLLLNDTALRDEGRFKMNPPLRSERDRQALLQGVKDGAIDMIATDHAPHSSEEKSKGLKESLMGVVGLETAFPLLYTYLVKEGIITMERLLELMHYAPKRRFCIGNDLEIGEHANLAVYDLNDRYVINSDEFASKGRSTPFDGTEVYGRCLMTIIDGRIVWIDKSIKR